ncbi:MAG: AMP-binding protein [Pseudomonadales bacterium]|nr:AMP-binding protein [Pseudomonadales bacterium]
MKNTHSFVNLTPTSFLERSGLAFPNKTAVVSKDKKITYAILLSRSRKLSDMLQSCDICYGDHVGLLTQNSVQGVEAHFAIPGAGGVIVSLNPWLCESDLLKQLLFSKIKILLVSNILFTKNRSMIESIRNDVVILVIDGASCEDGSAMCVLKKLDYYRDDTPLDVCLRSENDPIAMNFTSGTTGQPKGVIYTHRAAYLHAMGQVLMLSLRAESRYYWSLPMFHVNGWGHMWAVPVVGATQYISGYENNLDGANILKELMRQQISHLAGSPRLMKRIAESKEEAVWLKNLTVLTGGAAPTSGLVEKMRALGIDMIHQYGLNETCGPFVVCEQQEHWKDLDINDWSKNGIRQGVPAIHAGSGLRVVDSEGIDVPWDGETMGEIIVSGNTVANEYFDNLEATTDSFRNGWFHSGDIAVRHDDGYIQIKDRIKDIIHVTTDYGWENISSIEIENGISGIRGISDVAVIGVSLTNDAEDQQVVAFYELDNECDLDANDIRECCKLIFPGYKVPIYFIEYNLPKTATGKIKKNELKEVYKEKYTSISFEECMERDVEEVT